MNAFPWLLRLMLLNLCLCLLPDVVRGAEEALVPYDLRCEYLVDPIGVGVAKPRLSWKLKAEGEARGRRQTAWQVMAVDPDGFSVWNSGKVESGESMHRVFDGQLKSNQDCRWRVKVWDEAGREGPWSEPARMVAGLLAPEDWKGSWIRCREAPLNKHVWFRKRFSLKEIPRQAFLNLASIGYHELYVNGQRVDDRVLAPDLSNLTKRVLVVTYDIQPLLRQGENVIGIWTGPGWALADGSYGKGVWEQDPLLRCQVNFSDGSELHSDATWRCTMSHSENRGRWQGGGQGEYGGELIDARKDIPDWNQIAFDDSGWFAATEKDKKIELTAQMLEPTRKIEVIRPVKVTHAAGRSTFDMGRNFTGWIECDLRKGREGQVVKFMTANREGQVEEYDQLSLYIHDADGEGRFSHRFNYMAGRWITVEGLGYEPGLDDLRCHVVTNDRRRIGQFKCSNDLFNRIYEADLETYLANTVNGVTMDCPHRERYGYGEIALACSWGCGIPNYESAAFYRKGAQDWFDVQRKDGFVNTIAPQVYLGAGGTLWSSAPLTMSWESFRAYGDVQQLEHAYGPMQRWVDYLNRFVSDEGVLTAYESASRFLGDWATPHGSEYGDSEPAKLFNNCVYAYCLQVMVDAGTVLGRAEDARLYRERLEKLRTSVHRKFYNEATGQYLDGRQLSMAFPLMTGITPEPLRGKVMEGFIREIKERKPYLDTGSSGLPILLKFIVEHTQRPDLLFDCLNSRQRPGYGYFLERGENTWPEYWQVDGIESRIHTCYTGISGYFMRGVAGIGPDPLHAGMKQLRIQPCPVGDLEWFDASSESLYGRVTSRWIREANQELYEFEVPVNSIARVHFPGVDSARILEGGKPHAEAAGVRLVSKDAVKVVFELGSGRYRFSVPAIPP